MRYQDKINKSGSSVGINTFAQLTASVFDKCFFFILMLYFTRYMGATIYGEYLLVMVLILVFRMVVNFGLSRLFVRDLARDFSQIEDYIGNSIMLSIGLFIIFYIVLLVTGKALRYPIEIRFLIGIAGLSLLPFSLGLLFESTLHAMQYITKSSVWGVVNGFLTALSSILILHFGYGLKGVFVALIFVNLLYAGGLYLTLYRLNIHVKLKFQFDFILYILKNSFPFGLFSIMHMVYYSINIIILSKLSTNEAVGWFGAPFRLIETLSIIPASFAIALFPAMSLYYNESLRGLQLSYERALRYLIIIGLPLCVIGAILSKSIVPLLFGENFLPSIPVMTILFLVTLIMFAKTPGIVVILNSNNFNKFISFYFVHLMAAIGINYLLIYQYGYIGAGVAILITEIIIFIVHIYFLKLVLKKIPDFIKLFLRPLLATLIIGIAIIVFNFLPLFLLLISAVLVYFMILFISGEFTKEENLKIMDHSCPN